MGWRRRRQPGVWPLRMTLPRREPPVSHLADAAVVGLPTPIFSDRRDKYHGHPRPPGNGTRTVSARASRCSASWPSVTGSAAAGAETVRSIAAYRALANSGRLINGLPAAMCASSRASGVPQTIGCCWRLTRCSSTTRSAKTPWNRSSRARNGRSARLAKATPPSTARRLIGLASRCGGDQIAHRDWHWSAPDAQVLRAVW
jgi:hypothetical protein